MEEAFGCKPARWREAALPTQFLNPSGTTLAQFADGPRYIVTRFARAVLRIQNCVIKKNAGGEFAHANPMCRGKTARDVRQWKSRLHPLLLGGCMEALDCSHDGFLRESSHNACTRQHSRSARFAPLRRHPML